MLADGANRGTGAFIPRGASPSTTCPPGNSMPAPWRRGQVWAEPSDPFVNLHSRTDGIRSLAVVPAWCARCGGQLFDSAWDCSGSSQVPVRIAGVIFPFAYLIYGTYAFY